MKRLKILLVASEIAPFVSTGGLADAVGSLAQTMHDAGHDVRMVMPQYGQLESSYEKKLKHLLNFQISLAWRNETVRINSLIHKKVPVYFIDNPYFFHRPTLYENEDNHVQFAYFCRAVLEMLPQLDFQPDIIHCHDWHTGPLPLFWVDSFRHQDFYQFMKTVFTIHNIFHQGQFGEEIIQDLLAVDSCFWDEGLIRHDNLVNYLKMGILLSHKVTTVSEGYAQEIKRPECGAGLDYALRMRGSDFTGILNGISFQQYNPATDNRIYQKYNRDNLSGKKKNKRRLQKDLALPYRDVPLLGLISKQLDKKGLNLIGYCLEELMQEEIQCVILGSGLSQYDEMLEKISRHYRQKVAVRKEYDENLAHRIYAGSDLFLLPSRYEPSGYSQLISFRYGTIPVVRNVKGLKDTVSHYDAKSNEGNGFTFERYQASELLKAIREAREIYQNKNEWERLVKKVMGLDYSWKRSGDDYLTLYRDLL